MDAKEHMLILTLFSKQMQLIKILFHAVKDCGASEADLAAFEFAENADPQARANLLKGMWQEYVALAKAMEVQTGLENNPPPSI